MKNKKNCILKWHKDNRKKTKKKKTRERKEKKNSRNIMESSYIFNKKEK